MIVYSIVVLGGPDKYLMSTKEKIFLVEKAEAGPGFLPRHTGVNRKTRNGQRLRKKRPETQKYLAKENGFKADSEEYGTDYINYEAYYSTLNSLNESKKLNSSISQSTKITSVIPKSTIRPPKGTQLYPLIIFKYLKSFIVLYNMQLKDNSLN